VVPAGEFLMGSPETEAGRDRDEGPQVLVQFSRTIIIQEDEVTQAEWNRCVADGACPTATFAGFSSGVGPGYDSESMPVVNVSMTDAQGYIDYMSRITGERYRLPTEAEWEYSARGGTTTPWATGDELRMDDANYAATGLGQPSSLRFPGNAFGLKNMLGSVWEWVSGCPSGSFRPRNTLPCADPAGRWIVRGGSFADDANALRSANRRAIYPDTRIHNIGFRMVREHSSSPIPANWIELPR
jgi:formylglycine-generating enzyme required for sulfatase activity